MPFLSELVQEINKISQAQEHMDFGSKKVPFFLKYNR